MAMEDNWGTIIFLIFYLVSIWGFLIASLIKKNRSTTYQEKKMVWIWIFVAYFLLAFGDIFHLGFRIYIFFTNLAYEAAITQFLLGFGFVMTNITMTYFYIALFHSWVLSYGSKYLSHNKVRIYLVVIYLAFFIRLPLIFLPYNHWFDPDLSLDFGFDFRIITAIPLYLLGLIIVFLMFKYSKFEKLHPSDIDENINKATYLASVWLMVSFVCFSFTTFLVVYIPLMGLFMIPKTIAYLVALYYHYKYVLS